MYPALPTQFPSLKNLARAWFLTCVAVLVLAGCEKNPALDTTPSEALRTDPSEVGTAPRLTARIDGVVRSLLPEVTGLAPQAPLALAITQSQDSRLVGASVVSRYRTRDLTDTLVAPLIDYRRDTEIQLAFWDEILPAIVEGGFKNQHQVRRSRGTYDRGSRAQIEDQIAALEIGGDLPEVNELRPKYAFVSLKKPILGLEMTKPTIYGNVIAVLKEEIKDRATVTDGDSFNLSLAAKHYPENQFRPHSFDRRASELPRFNHVWAYLEAQIWGSLRIQDVEKFLVNCPNLQPVPPLAVEALKKTGLPVFQCVDGQPPVRINKRRFQNSVLQAGIQL